MKVEVEARAENGFAVLTLKNEWLRRELHEQYGYSTVRVPLKGLASLGFPPRFIQDLKLGPESFQMNPEGFEMLLRAVGNKSALNGLGQNGNGNGERDRMFEFFFNKPRRRTVQRANLSPLEVSEGFAKFFEAYITAALWSSTDDNEEPLDANYDVTDIDRRDLTKLRSEAERFYLQNLDMLQERGPEQGGHDFWLTRNGHGAGFWDGDWPQHGDHLTEASKAYGEVYLYVGDDGRIYVG